MNKLINYFYSYNINNSLSSKNIKNYPCIILFGYFVASKVSKNDKNGKID